MIAVGGMDGLVLLPVPLTIVREVAEYAAALSTGQAPPATGSGVDRDAVHVPNQGPWTQQMVTQLADSMSYRAVLGLLDLCATRANQWVPKSEGEAATGVSAIQLRNELGALSKKTRKLYGEATWPMEWKKERGEYSYRLHPTIAQWWLDARGEAKPTDRAEVDLVAGDERA